MRVLARAAARSMPWSRRCACSRTIRNSTRAPASALTRDGAVETDASVMDGANAARRRGRRGSGSRQRDRAGACGARARRARDARGRRGVAVRRRGRHHAGAPGSLVTERARKRLAEHELAQHRAGAHGGTVGAVARDRAARFAAATSTGGIVGKRAGASVTRRCPAPARGPMRVRDLGDRRWRGDPARRARATIAMRIAAGTPIDAARYAKRCATSHDHRRQRRA